jgi:hypothetical protein
MFKSSTISLASLVLLTSCNYPVNGTIFGKKNVFDKKVFRFVYKFLLAHCEVFLNLLPITVSHEYRFVPLGSSCFPWHPLLQHHKPMFHTKCGTRNQAWPKNRQLPIDYSISYATCLNLNRLQQRGTLLLSKHVTQCCCSPAVVTSAVCC